VYYIIEEQSATSVDAFVALFDFNLYLTSAFAKFQKQLIRCAVKQILTPHH
jgi:hypothetical protein